MIENEDQLRRAREALADLEGALTALSRKRGTMHPARFGLMAEPVAAHIRELRAEIDAFTGLDAIPPDEQPATGGAEEAVETFVGVLREIDLDERTFTVRDPDGARETRCQVPEDLLDVAREALARRVAVTGLRRRDPTRRQVFPLLVREIAVLGGDGKGRGNGAALGTGEGLPGLE